MTLHACITPRQFDAVLFDLDGVLTSTATIHASCWKSTFDDFLKIRAATTHAALRPFDVGTDYKAYVDGKLRYDGVRSFLASRDIQLPEGDPGDRPAAETVCGLGNRKDELVKEAIRGGAVKAYPGSIALVRALRARGVRTAVVSASNHCADVLSAAGILDLFDARVDGEVATALHLPGKPAPDTFLEAARRLGTTPRRAVVVEDAMAGVEAGRAGHFGLVIGVDRDGRGEALRDHGADVVVSDLLDLLD